MSRTKSSNVKTYVGLEGPEATEDELAFCWKAGVFIFVLFHKIIAFDSNFYPKVSTLTVAP